MSEVIQILHSGSKGRRYVAVLSYRFDESYEKRCFSIGGWIAEQDEWEKLERQWQKRIDFQNKNAAPNQQITRYHAQPMNGGWEEFANWTQEMKYQFGEKLMDIITRRKMGLICCGLDMDALETVFPRTDSEIDNRLRAYIVCIRVLMVEIGHVMREYFPNDRVLLIHDRGNWDAEALATYNEILSDPEWPSRDYFVSIAPLGWQDCVGLQAADLITFEAQKALIARLVHNSEEMRWALKRFESEKTPAIMKYVDTKTLESLRDLGQRN